MGTGYIKAGFSGEDLPRCVIPTVMAEQIVEIEQATMNPNGQMQEAKTKINRSFGSAAYDCRATHSIYKPIQRGIVTDPDHMTNLLSHIFETELGLDTKNMNVLMTDTPTNDKQAKQAICEVMFETFKVQRFTLINSATLSLFSTGTTTGLVAECGEGTTFTVPVFEGMALNHAIHRLDVSGLTVTEKLMDELIACDVKLDREQHLEVVRNMKEQMCAVSYDYEGDL